MHTRRSTPARAHQTVRSMTRTSLATVASFVLAFLGLGCDPQPAECDTAVEAVAVAVAFDYDCGPEDDMATLGAWGPRFVGAVVQTCDAGTLRIELDQPGTWRIEAKVGAEPTVECELDVTDQMIEDGVELRACEVSP